MGKTNRSDKGSRPGPRPSPGEVKLADVLLAGLERADPGPAPTRLQRTRYEGVETLTRALLEFWGGRTVAQVNQSSARAYRTWRKANDRRKRPSPEGKPVAERTLTSHLAFLKTQIIRFATERDLTWPEVNVGKLSHARAKPRLAPSRKDLARLAWGVRALRYSPGHANEADAPRGLQPPCFRPPTDEKVPGTKRRLRRHLLRLLLICYYSGSTAQCATRLRWAGSPEGAESYVDVEAGLLYRLGPDAAPGKAKGMPVPICWRLLLHLRRWQAIDARDGHDRIIRCYGERKPTLSPPTAAFRAARSDAGFTPDEMQMSMFQNATGAELMRKDVTVRSAAMYMGLDPKTMGKRFKSHRADFHEGAILAYQKRPRSIRSMPAASAAWRAAGNEPGRRGAD